MNLMSCRESIHHPRKGNPRLFLSAFTFLLALYSLQGSSDARDTFTMAYIKRSLVGAKMSCGKGCTHTIAENTLLNVSTYSSSRSRTRFVVDVKVRQRTAKRNCYLRLRATLRFQKEKGSWRLQRVKQKGARKTVCLPSVVEMLRNLSSIKGWSKRRAIAQLAYHGDTIRHLPQISPFLSRTTKPRNVRAMLQMLLELERSKVVPFLLDSLKQETVRRPEVLWALSQCKKSAQRLVPHFVTFVSSQDEKVRIAAIRGLGMFGVKAFVAVPQLQTLWQSKSSIPQKAAALSALGRILQGSAQLAILTQGYQSKYSLLQRTAVQTLLSLPRKDVWSIALKWVQWKKDPKSLSLLIRYLLENTLQTAGDVLLVPPAKARALLLKLAERAPLPPKMSPGINVAYYKKSILQAILTHPTDNQVPISLLRDAFVKMVKKNRYNSYFITKKLTTFQYKYRWTFPQLLDETLRLTTHQDRDVSNIAWTALVKFGPLAVPLRAKLMPSSGGATQYPKVKVLAVLGSMGLSGRSLPFLKKQLSTGNKTLQTVALAALSDLGARAHSLRESLYQLFNNTPPTNVTFRKAIIDVFVQMGPWGQPYLLKMLKSWNPKDTKKTPERSALLQGLLETGTPSRLYLSHLNGALSLSSKGWYKGYLLHLLSKHRTLPTELTSTLQTLLMSDQKSLYKKAINASMLLPSWSAPIKKRMIQWILSPKNIGKYARVQAVRALLKKGNLNQKELLKLAEAIVKNPKDPALFLGDKILKKLGAHAKGLIPTLVGYLKSSGWSLPSYGEEGLVAIGKASIPSLVKVVGHKNKRAAGRAANALFALKQHAALFLPQLFEYLKQPKLSTLVENRIVRTLRKSKKQALPLLAQALKGTNDRLKSRLLPLYQKYMPAPKLAPWLTSYSKTLKVKEKIDMVYTFCGQCDELKGDWSSFRPVLEEWTQLKKPYVVYKVLTCLKHLRFPQTLPLLWKLLKHKHRIVRRGSYQALLQYPLSAKKKRALMLNWLDEPNANTLYAAAKEASTWGTKAQFLSQKLLHVLEHGKLSFIRDDVRDYLLKIGPGKTLTTTRLLRTLKSKVADARLAAAAFLLQRNEAGQDKAMTVFKEEIVYARYQGNARREAAQVLSTIKHPKAQKLLVKLLGDHDRKLARQVTKAMLQRPTVSVQDIPWLVTVLEAKSRVKGAPVDVLKVLAKLPASNQAANRAIAVGLWMKDTSIIEAALKLLHQRGRFVGHLLPHIKVLQRHRNVSVQKQAAKTYAHILSLQPSSRPQTPRPTSQPHSRPTK